jgi:HAD superfamily hydrolase (TIGR01459 family)
MQYLSGLAPILDHYDAYLLDLWGVIHDGNALYPGVGDTLAEMHAKGKRIIFLSNAPRRGEKARQRLLELGIPADIAREVVTSGEAAYLQLAKGEEGWRGYAFCGPDRDRDLLQGLPYIPAAPEEADFLLNVGFTDDNEPVSYWMPLLEAARARNLPMLCANPDRIVVRLSGEVLPCAGQLADAYSAMGGTVQYFGKPYPDVYVLCLSRLAGVPKERILAIGDSLETDILGANRAGIASALITGGILKPALFPHGQPALDVPRLTRLCAEQGATPNYTLPGLIFS